MRVLPQGAAFYQVSELPCLRKDGRIDALTIDLPPGEGC